jgi:hypothetical protein
VRRVGEVHGAVGCHDEIVGRLKAVVGEVTDRAVERGELETGRRRLVRVVDGERQLREVHAAVLGHQDVAVGAQRGAVRASAGVGEHLAVVPLGPDAVEGAGGHARHDEGRPAGDVLGHPHWPFAEHDPVDDDLGSHGK